MINLFLLIIGYLLLFFSIIFFYYRFKKVELTKEDHYYWLKLEGKIFYFGNKILKLIKLSGKEIKFLWFNLLEKILRRIKIEALKIEVWANKKLEALKKEENNALPG